MILTKALHCQPELPLRLACSSAALARLPSRHVSVIMIQRDLRGRAERRGAPAALQPLVDDLDQDVLCQPRRPLRLRLFRRTPLWQLLGSALVFLLALLVVLVLAAVLMRL